MAAACPIALGRRGPQTPRMPKGSESRRVEAKSADLRKELGLGDLVLTQILYVVGLSWVGAAAKLGQAQDPFWLAAMALFYIPQAAVVIHLSRRFPRGRPLSVGEAGAKPRDRVPGRVESLALRHRAARRAGVDRRECNGLCDDQRPIAHR